MTVKEVMNTAAATCAPDSDLTSVVDAMGEHDCGFVPVVDRHGIVVGVVTDRDVCLAGTAKHRLLARVSVKEAMSHPVFSCFTDENLKTVLVTMSKHRVRRLPVLNKSGHLEGVLSIDDIVPFPETVDPDSATAEYRNGMLRVTASIAKPAVHKKVAITTA